MNNESSKENTDYEKWKENGNFPRPSSAMEPLRAKLPTWNAYILKCSEALARTVKNWGYYVEEPMPEISVKVTKCRNPIKCRSKLFLACLVWLDQDDEVVSYDQPIEVIVMNYDKIEYFIHADLWVQCKNGDVWMLNLIDSKTEALCKNKPHLLEAVELFCESVNCRYFPIREDGLKCLQFNGQNNRVDNSGHLRFD